MNIYEREVENFRKLNRIAKKRLPEFQELCDSHVPNLFRQAVKVFSQATGLSHSHQAAFLRQKPKDPLSFGYKHCNQYQRSVPAREILEAYEKIVAKLKNANKHCEIIIVSVCEKNAEVYPEALNVKLEELAKKHKCQYADISPAFSNDSPSVKAFSLLKYFMLDRLSFVIFSP